MKRKDKNDDRINNIYFYFQYISMVYFSAKTNTVFHGAIRSTGLYGSGLKCLKISSTGYIDIRLNLKFLKILYFKYI